MSIKLQTELCSSGTHCLHTFFKSEGLYPNHIHTFRPLRKYLPSFKKIGENLYGELRSQGTDYRISIHFHRFWGRKMTKFRKWHKLTEGLYPKHNHATLQIIIIIIRDLKIQQTVQVYNVQVRKVQVRKNVQSAKLPLEKHLNVITSLVVYKGECPEVVPGVKHPIVAKRAGGTGFYPEITNNALFNTEAPSSVLST